MRVGAIGPLRRAEVIEKHLRLCGVRGEKEGNPSGSDYRKFPCSHRDLHSHNIICIEKVSEVVPHVYEIRQPGFPASGFSPYD